jgi:hypothetical protein
MIKGILAATVLGSLIVPGLQAGTFTFNSSDSGWYDSTTGGNAKGAGGPTNLNYFAGQFPTNGGNDYNDYFVFNISGLTGSIVSATLTLDDSGTGAVAGGPLTYNVGSVSDPASSVSSSNPSLTIYNDLASGTLYGSEAGINAAGNVVITLDAAALTALGSAGSGFVFGGYITPIADASNHYLFTNPNPANDPTDVQLSIVTTSSSVPEPASLTLVGLGLLGFGLAARKRRS